MEKELSCGPEEDLCSGHAPSLPELLRGILKDLRILFEQQLTLFRHEVRGDLSKLKTGLAMLNAGAVVLSLGMLFLSLMLVHALHAAGALPLWGCYGIVGVGLALAGVGVLAVGRRKVARLTPLAPESTHALKETVRCLTNLK